jgi:REP element-mobilizing transposase RayT
MTHGHHRLRKGRTSQPGGIYLITFCTHARCPLFRNHDIATSAIAALLKDRHWTHATLLTWVLMPDHWHGPIQLHDDITLAHVIGRLKGATTSAVITRMHDRYGKTPSTIMRYVTKKIFSSLRPTSSTTPSAPASSQRPPNIRTGAANGGMNSSLPHRKDNTCGDHS